MTNGPQPGYRPALTGLTGHDVQSASASVGSDGASWVVNITFTPHGSDLFRTLTHNNVNACANPSAGCAQRHLPIWFDLTQADVDRWEDPSFVNKAAQLFDLRCLDRATATDVCPKLIADPVTLTVISGGHLAIGGFSEQTAAAVANAIMAELQA